MKFYLTVFGIAVAATMALTGCGKQLDSEGYFILHGQASWNGEPIKDGLIVFRTTESGKRNVAASINGGEFDVKIQPGKKTVEITAMREVPGKYALGASGEKIPAREPFIPKQFNTETELSADITFPEMTELNFDLKGS
ncbi:hypothetical protein M4951_13045 [Blastopirellula sp. J2-11]|uniref:hypothetical protein n=1 Tax=Blastopirellula sp. J2-11 TaxID=2943192 RepID=UPI0021C99A60|nr:hypothetical protein [Blastopirellula sp. J2-11]UUO04320.1 hypothetical protein M4951_13045 [Blastopirellula sp. J2-11]